MESTPFALSWCLTLFEIYSMRFLQSAIMIDCFMPTYAANEVHFADSEALKGTLVTKHNELIRGKNYISKVYLGGCTITYLKD